MIWLAFFTILAHLDRALQDAGRPAAPRRRRASARGRHGRDLGLQDALRGGHPLRDPRRARRRVPLDRLRQLLQPEHDGREGLHRARGGHLRQLASVGRGGCGAPLRLLERPRAAPARVLRVGGGALPGAAVRAHADRGRRRDRPLDPARSGRPSVQEAVNGGPPRPGSARASVVVGLLSVATMPAAIAATRWSEQYELLAGRLRDPARRARSGCWRSRSRGGRARGWRRRSATRRGRERPGSAASSACSASCSR